MSLIIQLLEVYSWIVIISALISWFPISPSNPLVQLLHSATEPLYAPIRSILDPARFGGMDISPIVVLIAISVLKNVLRGL